MSRATGWRTALGGLWSRTPRAAVALVVVTLLGWTLIEVVPRYSVERHRGEAPGRLDHPTFLIGDCPYYRATLVSLLEDHDLDVRNNLTDERYALPSNVARGRNGAFYPKHPILLAVAALPFYVVAGDAGLLAFNLAQLGALVLVMWIGARRYAPDWVAFAVMVWFAFGTLLRSAAYNFAPDVLSTLLVVGGVVALLHGRSLTAGALLGLSLWAKWTNLVFFPGRGGGAGGAARMARVAAFRCGGGGSGDGLARAELAHVRVAVRHALRSRAGRSARSAGSSNRRTGRSSRFRSGGACGRS